MLFNFATVGVFIASAFIFVFASLVLSRLVAPHNPYPEKILNYECGEHPIGPSWIRFNNRFYIIAMIFLLFDVEIIFILPCAVVFGKWAGQAVGWFIFLEIFIFVVILLCGLAYVWAKGDLNWVKTTHTQTEEGQLVTVDGEVLPPAAGTFHAGTTERECRANE